MEIGFYRWKETPRDVKTRLMRRSEADIDALIEIVQPILENVKNQGDQALIALSLIHI